ncbi:hypothetical protein COCHEDRAFT_1119081 [Bipolaris maydis C5]|uniref:Peptidase A1 domain-containing protein n=2 Tax=Cochliobolus heterostrophus TaxID=5016 RepID=M2SHJ4_COCH5|nr:hypothetical protein COCHEDRAFT_1121116 [Bipolaris maydis C5]EMD85457.1 hypothetical protein COCHEDRAFT_1119081 [Bipolaris maydis C5]KAJ5024667.1 aspartic peptidase domain-containing protein [Bipolaris maydis]KAJ6266332.1 aspartic peptidase domain-containing protein [Bipolaris maydis]KAJ6281345.1 aspartic peptidase domain-containing protein [Bipolaris maydis]
MILLPTQGSSTPSLSPIGYNDANLRPRTNVDNDGLVLRQKLDELGLPIDGIELELKTARLPAGLSLSPGKKLSKRNTDTRIAPLYSIRGGGGMYAVDVQVNGETFRLLADTGSSDMWLPSQDLKCVNSMSQEPPPPTCNFTKFISPTYSGGQIPNRHFNITYANGNSYLGTVGYESVSIANLTVQRQVVAKVNFADQHTPFEGGWNGLLGLGFPNLTSAFPGLDPSKDNISYPNPHNAIPYNPWIMSAYESGIIKKPVFTLLVKPVGGPVGENAGSLIIGGAAPPGLVQYRGGFGRASLRRYNPPYRNYFWDFIPNGMALGDKYMPWNETAFDNGTQAFSVDSGSDYTYLPESIMTPWLESFNPPVVYDSQGASFALCNATFDSVAIRVGGEDLPFEKSSLLLQPPFGAVNGKPGYCWTGIQPSGTTLGGTFLSNVAATFDMTPGLERVIFASIVRQ